MTGDVREVDEVSERGDNRRPTYLEERDGEQVRIWRASGLGACDRSLVMHALEHTPHATPEHVQRAFDHGHQYEDEILAAFRKKGWKSLVPDEVRTEWGSVDATGQVVCELDVGAWKGVRQVIRCHPDDIAVKHTSWPLVDEDEVGLTRVVEAKFLKPGTYGDTPNKARMSHWYSWQTSVEMLSTGLPLALVIGWKVDDEDGGVRVERVDVGFYDNPVYTLGQIKARVFKIARMIDRAEEEGLGVASCDWKMYPCPFYDMHDGQDIWVTREEKAGDATVGLNLEQSDLNRLKVLASSVRMHAKQAEQHTDKAKAARQELREELARLGGEKGNTYAVGGFVIEWQVRAAKPEQTYVRKATEETEVMIVKEAKKGKGGEGDG